MKTKILILSLIVVFSERGYSQWNTNKLNKKNNVLLFGAEKRKFDYNFFEALKQKHLRNYDEALMFFNKCIKINPNIALPYYELARIQQKTGNKQEALKMSLKAFSLDQKNETYTYLYAKILSETGDIRKSISIYKKLIAINKKSDIYYYELSDLYIMQNQLSEAVKVYDELQKVVGINKILSLQKHKIYMSNQNVEKANKELMLLSKEYPQDTDILEILAEGYLLDNQKELAFEVFKKISELDEKNGRVNVMLYEYYISIKEYDNAFKELVKAFESSKLSIDGKIPILISYLELLNDSSLNTQAFTLCRKLVKTHNDDPKAYAVFADLLYEDRQLDSAEYYYRKTISLDKTKPQVWVQLVLVCAEKNDFVKVFNETNNALLYFPTNSILYYFNGVSLMRKGDYSEAINPLTLAIDYVFENKVLLNEIYSSLAECYNETTNFSKSDSLFDLSLEINPENPTVLNNYSYYLSLRGVNLEKAKKMSIKSNQIEPNNGTFQDTYAWILYKLKNFEEALIWILKAIKNGSDSSPVVIEHYGDILYKLNKKERALEQWNKAKKLGKGSKFLEKKIVEKKLYE